MKVARFSDHRSYVLIAAGVVCLSLLAWGASRLLERLVAPAAPAPQQRTAGASPSGTAHITATLFYATADSDLLVGVRREVPLADGIVAQGRQIVTEQMEPAPPPYLTVIPEGTTLRAFYVTERGDAFVDLSSEVWTRHPGGSSTELLTVYAIVNAVTANLPTIQRVQILIDGKEVETLAGHIDLRRPLEGNLTLVREEAGTQ
jgi:hypothetical protein